MAWTAPASFPGAGTHNCAGESATLTAWLPGGAGTVTCSYSYSSSLAAYVLGSCSGVSAPADLFQLSFSTSRFCEGTGAATINEPLDDGNPCTIDTCDIVKGPQYANVATGTYCGSQGDAGLCSPIYCSAPAYKCPPLGPCGDYSFCTSEGPPVGSNAGTSPCMTMSCDPTRGIVETPIPDCGVPPSVTMVDNSVPGDFYGSTSFLSNGSTAITPQQASVLRGRVLETDGLTPIPNVTISILNHPEFGNVTTRSDGWFDILVNGGSTLTVVYQAPHTSAYLTVHRKALARWHDYTVLPDVVLTPRAPANSVTFAGASWQAVSGPVTTTAMDSDGQRQAVLLIPPGTVPTFTGTSTQAPNTLTLHITEYTVGSKGALAMPADLPSNSGYTYALEFSVDEADMAGATSVQFSQPLALYVNNFPGFPATTNDAGTSVPAGFYDRDAGAWKKSLPPSDAGPGDGGNGQIVTITGFLNGAAQVTTNSALSLSSGELQQLNNLYGPGSANAGAPIQLWRVPIEHFSGWDLNWGYGPPPGAGACNCAVATSDSPIDHSCTKSGSIIECQNQILAEEIPITGTPYALRYQSERQRGRVVWLDVPIMGPALAAPMPDLINVTITVAGNEYQYLQSTAGIQPNAKFHWTWDRTDAYDRHVPGPAAAHVAIGYVYADDSSNYTATSSFGDYSSAVITGNRALRQTTMWQYYDVVIGQFDAKGVRLGGWDLTAHHTYDYLSGTLYAGDGRRTSAKNLSRMITSIPYGGSTDTQAQALVAGPDGAVYVSDWFNTKIWRIDPNPNVKPSAFTTPGGLALLREVIARAVRSDAATWAVPSRNGSCGGMSDIAATNGRVRGRWPAGRSRRSRRSGAQAARSSAQARPVRPVEGGKCRTRSATMNA